MTCFSCNWSTLWPLPTSHFGSAHGFFLLFVHSKSYGKQLFSMGYQCRIYYLNNLPKIDLFFFSYILRGPSCFVKPKRMGTVVPLFSAVFGLSLLKASTLNQVKRSLLICIELCFAWALSVPRPSLGTPSLWCPHLPSPSHAGPSWAPTPRQRQMARVSVWTTVPPGALALGKGGRLFSGSCSMWALTPWGGHVPPGKARGDLSVISGFGIPPVWQDGVGAPG